MCPPSRQIPTKTLIFLPSPHQSLLLKGFTFAFFLIFFGTFLLLLLRRIQRAFFVFLFLSRVPKKCLLRLPCFLSAASSATDPLHFFPPPAKDRSVFPRLVIFDTLSSLSPDVCFSTCFVSPTQSLLRPIPPHFPTMYKRVFFVGKYPILLLPPV